jgi:hypothetical protein
MQAPTIKHAEPTGPAPVVMLLQVPSTASSGRKLIITSFGDSYGFRLSEVFASSVI